MNSSNNTGCRPLLAPDRVIVKFAEGVLPTTPPRPVEQRREADDTLSKVLDSVLGSGTRQGGGGSAGLSVRRYLEGEQEAWQALVCRAQARNPGFRAPRFQDYVEVSLPVERCAEDVASAFLQEPKHVVEDAYVLRGPAAPPLSDTMPLQLRVAPRGVGAAAAWRCSGGLGQNVVVVDVEQGWYLEHGDLPSGTPSVGVNLQYRDHGGMVLGVLFARDGGNRKTLGIARGAQPKLVSEWSGSAQKPDWRRTGALLQAAKEAGEGDVILLEGQTFELQPVEVVVTDGDAIRAAVEAQIVVVEAAGNSAGPLLPLDVDSGAIVVGASESGERPLRRASSGYGSRVDCYAPGSLVRTIAVPSSEAGEQEVPDSAFLTGTSAAAAIVAGMAACIQGIARSKLGAPLSPKALRDIMRNKAYGTPVFESDADIAPIGHIPDLEKICRLEFGLYMAISSELTYTLSAAQPGSIQVTVQSSGTVALEYARLFVYWAPSPESEPTAWKPVGSATLSGVLPGETSTLSFSWPPSSPPTGPFVLVGVLSDSELSNPNPPIPTIPGRIAKSAP